MLNQDTQLDNSGTQTSTNRYPNNNINHNPLNDHDYCSPNKRLATQQPHQQQLESPDKSLKISKINNKTNLISKFHAPDSVASTSSSPNPYRNSGRHQRSSDSSTLFKSYSNDNLSDSSSSSSSVPSSVSSTKELLIAQDSQQSRAKLFAPKDTPSVSRRKPGRKPARKDMGDGEQEKEAGPTRAKRVRQSTSVTDSSEWIMNDEIDSVLSEHLDDMPREKRHKSEHDSPFNQYASGDYSSSDVESDQESDNSEDDPNRLWCLCQKPHDGKFMICCDVCKDWFHGHCVGVTKLMSDRFEKQGKEWFCGECREKIRAGVPRNAIPEKIVKKETKKKKKVNLIPGKRGRGRPRKSETIAREGPTRVSQRNVRKSSSSLDPKIGVDNGRLRKNLARPDARSESFDEFEDSQRLKLLIKERKREFFYKRNLNEQQKAAKRNELGLGRQPLTANLSDSLDSLATSTSSPNMGNMPMNIKSEHKERSKPNIVLQINTKKDPSTDQSNSSSRIVTAIVRSPKKSKHADSIGPIVSDLFTAEPIQIAKKANTSLHNASAAGDLSGSNGDTTRKHSSSSIHTPKNEKSSAGSESSDAPTSKKKRKDSESTTPNGSYNPGGSKHIAQKIKDSLETRSNQIKDLQVSSDKIEELAKQIEGQLNECFKEGTQKYLNKFRSLLFNLRDTKNQGLVRNVLTGEITPTRLVRMSSDEMASQELARWRERENKHSIELIKRDAQLAAQQVIVKKTHKGEEVISAPSLNEPDDPTAEVANQEPPTTPTKHTSKETRADGSKINLTPPPTGSIAKSAGPLKMKITGITSDSPLKTMSQDAPGSSSTPNDDTLLFLDTTKEHKNHIFDISCKICTKQTVEPSGSEPESKQEAPKTGQGRRTSESEHQSDQPKRFRVSIDTKLDPANLSRLREPLVRPRQEMSIEMDGYSPSRTPPFESANNGDGQEDGQEDGDYDPESPPLPLMESSDPTKSEDSGQPCWSGSITMPDIARFSASARPVRGLVDFMRGEMNQELTVCGRIAPDQVQGYIKKLKSTTKNQILIIQLFPLTENDKANFDTFFDYLYSRNRYGVISTSPQVLKDFYVLPIHEKSSIPEVLKPLRYQAIDRKEPNCLLGLLVRSKRPTQSIAPSQSTSTYTPTPIK